MYLLYLARTYKRTTPRLAVVQWRRGLIVFTAIIRRGRRR